MVENPQPRQLAQQERPIAPQGIDAGPYHALGMILGPNQTRPPLQNVIDQYHRVTTDLAQSERPNVRIFDTDTKAYRSILAATLQVNPDISMTQLRDAYPDLEQGINTDYPRDINLAYQELLQLTDPNEMSERRDEIKKDAFKKKLKRYTRKLLPPFTRSRDDADSQPQLPLKTRIKRGAAALTAVAALGGLGVANDTTEPQISEKPVVVLGPGISPQQENPEQPTQATTEPTSDRTFAISAPEPVQEGQSLWKAIRSKVSEIETEHKRKLTSVATKFAAFENGLADANDIAPGTYKVLDKDSLAIIRDALDNPPGRHATEEDKQLAADVKTWADSGIRYDQLVQDEEEQQRFLRISQRLQEERQRSLH